MTDSTPEADGLSAEAALPGKGAERTFPCAKCGADLSYSPETGRLRCEHCGAEDAIPEPRTAVSESDYGAGLADLESHAETIERLEVRCESCGASVQFENNVTSRLCPFCGSSIVAQAVSRKKLKPTAVLPFKVGRREAIESYRAWLSSRWFAPSKLKREAFLDGAFVGAYLPFWTYDCVASTRYDGMRGDDYWVTESYTVMVNGRPTTQTRQVRRTRWTPVSGSVVDDFDDVLIPASRTLSFEDQVNAEPWGLESLVPYDAGYLAGFRCESYAVTLSEGFEGAKHRMRPTIESSICADIGGDHQRIGSMHTAYDRVTFKHILLPVWVSAYRFHRRVYRVLINGRTGELVGDRPYSGWKITGLVLACLTVIGVIVLIASMR
ncbi:MAG: hypothetical protein U0573_07350 [Phycisphaerales bacterium]|nr:hypothetical protein [Planctomycetota bacterium]